MTISVMQPYVFPYIGYFQLIKVVDKFIFYDDVTFIKGGWINRNRILINKEPKYFTIPLNGSSSNRPINEIRILSKERFREKFIKTINHSYKGSPNKTEVIDLIEKVLNEDTELISEIAANSVITVSRYLGLQSEFFSHSQLNTNSNNSTENRTLKLMSIIKEFEAETFINPKNGQHLYDKIEFLENGIELKFLEAGKTVYSQDSSIFHPGLSIIDVLMNNNRQDIKTMLTNYVLV